MTSPRTRELPLCHVSRMKCNIVSQHSVYSPGVLSRCAAVIPLFQVLIVITMSLDKVMEGFMKLHDNIDHLS